TQHLENIPLSVTDSSGRAVWLASSSASSGYNVYYLINTSTKIVYNSAGTALGTFKSVTTPTSSTSPGTLTYTVTSGKTTTTYTVSGMYADTWWLARNFGLIRGSPSSIELRIDAETTAARNLVTFAQNTVATYNTTTHPVTYKMQFYQFSYGNPTALTSTMTDVNSLTTATVPDLGLNSPLLYTFNYWTSASTQTNDADSDFAKMFTTMNTTIPAPGDGSTPSTPQEVMFIVTDGMVDQAVSGYSCQSSGRACTQLLASHLTQCTTIKNRGIRIAVLYTEYLASTIQGFGLSFANTIATSAVPNIEAQLQSCASTNPDGTLLYYKVSADEDISSALTQLFSMAVQTAYLAR
ncbi:MAG TPA: hypothetical protein VN222_16970, partial [Novosphingobium sp.]|nr:hypothetical protein [Novosphingobium sp.]